MTKMECTPENAGNFGVYSENVVKFVDVTTKMEYTPEKAVFFGVNHVF